MPYIVFDTMILNALLFNLKHREKTVSLDRIMVNFFILKNPGVAPLIKFLKNHLKYLHCHKLQNITIPPLDLIYKIYLRHLDCIFSLSHTYQLIVTLWPSKIDTIQLRVGGITGVENFQNCQNRRSRKTLAQNCQIQLRKLPQPQKSLRDFFGLRPLASQKAQQVEDQSC